VANFIVNFALRWTVSSLGLWVASGLLGPERLSTGAGAGTLLGAGFFLALVNMALKPIIIFLSLPAIILSLGLFMLIVNGVMILIAHWLYNPLYVKNLGVAVIAGIILALVNFLVSVIFKDVQETRSHHKKV
jgi:putative membrane protein